MPFERQAFLPAHIPAELLFDFDFWEMDPDFPDPLTMWSSLDARGAPPIFYTLANGGHWVFRRFEDVREGLRNHVMFTSTPQGIPYVPGQPLIVPVEVDPPEHQKYRLVLAPLFTPAMVKNKFEDQVRRLAAELIDSFANRGACDFVADYSRKLPTSIFLAVMGMPHDRLPDFLVWERDFFHGLDLETKQRGIGNIKAYLREFLMGKRANPGDDVPSMMLKARDAHGEPWSEQELNDCLFNLFVAGLDTVTNALTMSFRYLACQPVAQRFVLTHPDRLRDVTEELLRINAVANLPRRVRHDTEYKGIAMRRGEAVLLVPNQANRDPDAFDQPDMVDLSRETNQYLTFGAGPHRCLGSHLAKQELLFTLEEWFRRIPEFSLAPEADLQPFAGHVFGLNALPLAWKPQSG